MNPSKQSLEDVCRSVTSEGDSVVGNYWVDKAVNRCYEDGVPHKEVEAILDRYRHKIKQTLQPNT